VSTPANGLFPGPDLRLEALPHRTSRERTHPPGFAGTPGYTYKSGLVQTPQQAVAVVLRQFHAADDILALAGWNKKIGLFEGGTTEFPIFYGTLLRACCHHCGREQRSTTATACRQRSLFGVIMSAKKDPV